MGVCIRFNVPSFDTTQILYVCFSFLQNKVDGIFILLFTLNVLSFNYGIT